MAIPRVFALGGVAGPLLFAAVVVVSAALRPEYRHFSQFISELGETGSRTQELMNLAGFLPAGVLVFVASLALLARFRETWPGRLGSICVSVFGAAMFTVGLFPCDAGCMPDVPSRSQLIHDAVGLVADPAVVLAPLLLAFALRKRDRWRSMFSYSVATSLASLAALIAIVSYLPERAGSGLLQRLYVGLPLLWLMLVSWRLWKSAEDPEAA